MLALGVITLCVFDMVSASRTAYEEDPPADSSFLETGNSQIDAVTTARPTARVAIVRSDWEALQDKAPITAQLTTAQIHDMVYAAIGEDVDYAAGTPRLEKIIADKREELGSCWVVVKPNVVFQPGVTFGQGTRPIPGW